MNPKWLIISAALKVVVVVVVVGAIAPVNTSNMVKPGCTYICGNVKIPFPFGIGPNCFLDHWYEVKCKNSPTNKNSKTPFLSELGVEIMEVTVLDYSSSNSMVVRMPLLHEHECSADLQVQQLDNSFDLRGGPFSFSSQHNILVMDGCPGSAVLVNEFNTVMAGCATVCHSKIAISKNSCYGVRCCQAPLQSGTRRFDDNFQFYQIQLSRENSSCLAANIVKAGSLDQFVGNLSRSDPSSAASFPLALEWGVTSNHIPHKKHHADCYSYGAAVFHCVCDSNYNGNPYLSNGCKGPDGCHNCRGGCIQRVDAAGNPISGKYYCEKLPPLDLAATIGISSSFGVLLLAASIYGLYRFVKWRREIKRRNKFFKRNGGLLLNQQLSSSNGVVERTKIFTERELEKATDQFNKNRILGEGGQGTVFKGMLTDGSIVAVKKSKLVDENQLEQFINEVVILSRVNHRHVVKLFGCCLETEVPLLVYEFIPNGTLFQHIHDPDENFSISWAMRLKIAADSAGAVAYLHSSSSIPIYHRDIKSSNILLDEKHRAKVSDFGCSKTMAIDQTHMTTLVQGTMGYLDPEYFQTYQFTGKSDVYSFGVVILELLTSKKPIYRDASSMEQKNLVTEFLFMTQSLRLSDILDPKVVMEAKEDELISMVELAKRCTSWSAKLRPTMKEVAMTLEMIVKSPAQVCEWYQKQDAFPIQYAAYDEFDMSDISGAEFMSNTLHASCSSPPYADEISLLSDVI